MLDDQIDAHEPLKELLVTMNKKINKLKSNDPRLVNLDADISDPKKSLSFLHETADVWCF